MPRGATPVIPGTTSRTKPRLGSCGLEQPAQLCKLGLKIIDGILAGLGELKTMVGNAIGGAIRAAIEAIDFWVGPFHLTGLYGIPFSMPSFGSRASSATANGGRGQLVTAI